MRERGKERERERKGRHHVLLHQDSNGGRGGEEGDIRRQ